jgi:translocation and assembly module TamA
LGQVTIAGTIPPNFQPSLGISPGQDAVAAKVLEAKDRLLTELREAGYPLATVALPAAVLHRDRGEVDVSFQVEAGSKAALGSIRLTGLRDVNEAFIRRHLLLQPGEQFSPSGIETARQDLLSLGVFSSVRILPAERLDPNGDLPLDVDFQERKPHAVDFGAAWSTDLGANLNAAWHHRNLFGQAEQLNLTAAVQLGGNALTKPGAQLGAQFIKPDFLRRDQSLEVNLNLVDQSLLAYDQRALIERVGITRKLSPQWSVQAGVLAEQEGITQEHVSRSYDFVGLPLSIKYDSSNNLLDPVSGIRATVSVTPFQALNGSKATFLVTQASMSAYFDLGTQGRSVIAMRGLVGQASGVGVFGLPPDQRLYAGGSGTVRGFRYQSIGPRFADGRPTGGTAVSAATIEFRQRFLEHWGTATFVDVGQASSGGGPFGANWRAGAGAGLRYYTPIGPIRVDFAVPLIAERGGDSFEVYIGIGQAF